ncbi:MAG TPA: hypothetical protein VM144_03365 [Aestuariivirga sp.]|nr:hypothetical protein [Aestuariivirga sp.]
MLNFTTAATMRGVSRTPFSDFLIYVGLSLIAFGIVKLAVLIPIWGINSPEALLWVMIAVFTALTVSVRASDLPPGTAMILRIMYAGFAIYLAFSLTLPDDAGFGFLTDLRLRNRQFFLPILCVLGFWRPTFGVVAMMGAICERNTLGAWFGNSLSQTEFFTIVEVCVFLLIAAALLPIAKIWLGLSQVEQPFGASDRLSTMTKMTLLAICVHLSNYFYSGFAKIFIGTYPLSWMIANHTENMILVHNEYRQLPLSLISGLPQLAFDGFQYVVIALNATTFLGQLFALVAPLRIRWVVIVTAFYDVMHLIIFFVSGIFFYKWILLNIAIVVALRHSLKEKIDHRVKLMSVGMVILAPVLFNVANLAWFDIRTLNHERIYAVLDDKTEIEVPSNYWGTFSIHYAQQRRLPKFSGNLFPPRYGKTQKQSAAEAADGCQTALAPADSASQPLPDPGVVEHILGHHQYVLSHLDAAGRIDYDFYPHHIWSMPWEYLTFRDLDKRRIRAYRIEVEAVCLGIDNGDFTRKVVRSKSYVIPLPGKLDTL